MYAYIDTESHATFYGTLDEARAAWIAARGEGQIAEMLSIAVVVAARGWPRGGSRGMSPDPASQAGRIRELLQQGGAPMRIAETVGVSRQLVYQERAKMRRNGELDGPKKPD